mgnify:FL=1
MSNPFTSFLRQWNRRPDLDEFVRHWDVLERVMVDVHRRKMAPAEAQPEFVRVWGWLGQNYGDWREVLRPFWQQTKAGGVPTQTDPFQLIINIPNPQAIVDNWRAMQHLPAAREALNHYILSQVEA